MQRNFCLGSQWLYYKIYTGVKTTDFVLSEKLNFIISDLEDRDIIQKWFFIRYKDANEHIRIRFLVKNTEDLFKVIQSFYSVLNTLLEDRLVWNIQTDTYKREIERYGQRTMLDSEFLFWEDSKMTLSYIKLKSQFTNQHSQLLFSFYAIDSFLNSFKLSDKEKLSLMNGLQSAFKIELEADKEQKKEMAKSYLLLYPKINDLLSNTSGDNFKEIVKIVNKKSKNIAEKVLEIKTKIEIPFESFLVSHIHMMINRQYTSKQKTYELIIYDHLFRFYKFKNYKKQNIDLS